MSFGHKSSIVGVFCMVLMGMMVPVSAFAYQITAKTTYHQAQLKNEGYFQVLSRYKGAIDLLDHDGNTAYCLALKDNDKEAQAYLAGKGANREHECVSKPQRKSSAQSRKFIDPKAGIDGDSSYLWGGAGLLLVSGSIVAFSGGGGGDGSDDGGNNGGSNNGGGNGFADNEYQNGNFLEAINADGAYKHMYTMDENGVYVSHQSGSDIPLEKVKVGILDTGVFSNQDLDGKIVKRYGFNHFDENQKIFMYTSADNRTQGYVVEKDNKYYLFRIHKKDGLPPFEPVWIDENGSHSGLFAGMQNKKLNWGIDEADLEKIIAKEWGISFDDMTLINQGEGFPKIDISALDPNLAAKDLYEKWGILVEGINHGTHVAGIIAANKNDSGMHGVAFENAEILATAWGLSSAEAYAAIKAMVDDGAVVLNNSWGDSLGRTIGYIVENYGGDTVKDENGNEFKKISADFYRERVSGIWDAYVYGAKNGAVWVQATGNEEKSDAGMYAGMGGIDLSDEGYQKSDIAVPYLAVAALDYSTKSKDAVSGELASYSNMCGNAAKYCLAAPGSDILSTSATQTGGMYLSGTSMATPVVSGSIALLKGYYPWLNAQNVAYLLLETANKSGVYGKSEIYGQGALDLEAAVTTPVGGLGLPENESFSSLNSAYASKLLLSSPVQGKLASVLPKTVTAFDKLNRPFEYDTAELVNTTHASNANLRQAVGKIAMAGVKKTVKDDKAGFQFTTDEALSRNGQANFSSVEVLRETDNGVSRFYYATNSKYASSDNVLKNSSNPYLAMNEAYGAENMLKLSDTSKLRFSIQTGENGLYERDYEQDKHSFDERAYTLTGEYSFNLTDYLEVAALGGMLFENDAMLGMNGTGMLGIKDSSTYFMGVKAALNLTPEVSILAAYYRGYTQGAEASLLSVSDLVTESFMFAGEYRLNKTDKVGLSFSSPLSVVKGRASLMYANGRDMYSDTIYMQKLETSLKPEAREYDLGLYYQGQPKEDVNLMGKIEARFNADGDKGLVDYIGIVGAGVAF